MNRFRAFLNTGLQAQGAFRGSSPKVFDLPPNFAVFRKLFYKTCNKNLALLKLYFPPNFYGPVEQSSGV